MNICIYECVCHVLLLCVLILFVVGAFVMCCFVGVRAIVKNNMYRCRCVCFCRCMNYQF